MDGTLLKTADVVPDSFLQTAEAYGAPGLSREDIVKLYSLGVPENMLTSILGRHPEPAEMEYFYKTLESNAKDVSVYPEIEDSLGILSNHISSCVFTGASQRSAEILIKATGIAKYFEIVVGGDEFPPKPAPEGIRAVMDAAKCSATRTAYIGDAPTDMKAAQNAEVSAFGAGWGHLYKEGSGELYSFRSPSDLVKHLLKEP